MPRTALVPYGEAVTTPQVVFMRREGVGRNVLNKLFRTGELDSVVIGGRYRHVINASWHALLERRRLGVERPEHERQAAIEAYQRSLLLQGSRIAAKARSGWTGGNRPADPRQASTAEVPPLSLLPRPEPSPGHRKSSLSKRVSTTKDTAAVT